MSNVTSIKHSYFKISNSFLKLSKISIQLIRIRAFKTTSIASFGSWLASFQRRLSHQKSFLNHWKSALSYFWQCLISRVFWCSKLTTEWFLIFSERIDAINWAKHQQENPSKLIRMIPMEESFLKIWNEILLGLNLAQKSDENEKSIRLVLKLSQGYLIDRYHWLGHLFEN